MKKWVLIIALLTVSFAISGCASHITIPEDNSFPVEGAEVYDDIVNTPGGAAYRANVHQEGEVSPWPPVESAEVTLNGVYLRYRDYIETGAGETRNNIFTVRRDSGFREGSLNLYATAIPAGIEFAQSLSGGLPGTLTTVLVIEISADIAPGQYSLEIGLKVEGQSYGTVTCTIEVVDSV